MPHVQLRSFQFVLFEVLQHCAGLSHENVEAFDVKHVIFKGMDGMEASTREISHPVPSAAHMSLLPRSPVISAGLHSH